MNGICDLPFGTVATLRRQRSGFVNQFIGDWSIAGLMRWTSGFPFNVINCRSCWPTNWNLQGNASLVDPNVLPETETTKNVVDGLSESHSSNPTAALTFFRLRRCRVKSGFATNCAATATSPST